MIRLVDPVTIMLTAGICPALIVRGHTAIIAEYVKTLPKYLLVMATLRAAKKVYFLEEVRRIENQLRDGLRMSAAAADADDAAGDTAVSTTTPPASLGAGRVIGGISPSILPLHEDEIRKHLEEHKDSVRLEAMVAVHRHRDHLAALRKATNAT